MRSDPSRTALQTAITRRATPPGGARWGVPYPIHPWQPVERALVRTGPYSAGFDVLQRVWPTVRTLPQARPHRNQPSKQSHELNRCCWRRSGASSNHGQPSHRQGHSIGPFLGLGRVRGGPVHSCTWNRPAFQ
jgi:hypothetical protein